jgi:hypothetical protein
MGINSKAWRRQSICLATALSLFAILSVGLGGWAHADWQIPGIETDSFAPVNAYFRELQP